MLLIHNCLDRNCRGIFQETYRGFLPGTQRQLALIFSVPIVCNTARVQKGYLSLGKVKIIVPAQTGLA